MITTCYYDTTVRDKMLPGGFTAHDEMCVNYVHYYPATELELCKSSVGEQALDEFFRWQHSYGFSYDTSLFCGYYFIIHYISPIRHSVEQNEAVVPGGPRSDNFEAIHWTEQRNVDLLYSLYTNAPLSMQCNRSDGMRFDGDWEGVPPVLYDVQVKMESAVADETCPGYNPYFLMPLQQGVCGYMGDCVY